MAIFYCFGGGGGVCMTTFQKALPLFLIFSNLKKDLFREKIHLTHYIFCSWSPLWLDCVTKWILVLMTIFTAPVACSPLLGFSELPTHPLSLIDIHGLYDLHYPYDYKYSYGTGNHINRQKGRYINRWTALYIIS